MERFTAHRLRFVLETRTPIYLQAHKGSALRGGLFHALRSRFCLDGSFSRRTICLDCQLHRSCPICFLIATVDENSERGQEVPRPYVIESPLDGKTEYPAGEVWEFGLTMFDRALNLFPYVILGVQQLGEDGLGAGRGRFRVREVWAQNPLTSTEQRLAQWEDRLVSVPNIPITHEQVMERASVLANRNRQPEEMRQKAPQRHRGYREGTGNGDQKSGIGNPEAGDGGARGFGYHPEPPSIRHPDPSMEGEGSTPSSKSLSFVQNDRFFAPCHPELAACHSERSEESTSPSEIVHCVQNDSLSSDGCHGEPGNCHPDPSLEGEGSTPSSGVLRPVKNDQVFALTLNLKTPLRLVKEGKLVHRLDFATLMARLFERLTALSSTYSSAALSLPFRDMLALADRVEVVDDETGWMELDRYSSRQKRPLPMGGLVGRITFRGELGPFLPWLLWGQYTHLGKMATMGNGWYEIGVKG